MRLWRKGRGCFRACTGNLGYQLIPLSLDKYAVAIGHNNQGAATLRGAPHLALNSEHLQTLV